ncbi:hypothetical protein D9613_005753 [Agrocybe pediades]|uniref:Uncharacterized protein n=1 Tax=Agrocybe pediades TaxID=84607 RepID=A0A8H4QUB9_9AGAR|nr:hypothetical protein D9613_005753 [Agrocybe pediades]
MSATRLARTAFQAATRRTAATPATTMRVSKRAMSASSHAGAKTKSDTPWLVASALVFGPAFLYLVSPSARKKEHLPHNDKHDFPNLQTKTSSTPESKSAPVELMKDSEGTEANVASSIELAQTTDSPNEQQSPEKAAEIREDAEAEGASSEASSQDNAGPAPETVGKSPEGEQTTKEGSHQRKGETGITSQDVGKESAQKGITPKTASEIRDKEAAEGTDEGKKTKE